MLLLPVTDCQPAPADTEDHYVATWKALEPLVAEGLVRNIGLSNFNSKQIQEVWDAATLKPSVLQVYVFCMFVCAVCATLTLSVWHLCPRRRAGGKQSVLGPVAPRGVLVSDSTFSPPTPMCSHSHVSTPVLRRTSLSLDTRLLDRLIVRGPRRGNPAF